MELIKSLSRKLVDFQSRSILYLVYFLVCPFFYLFVIKEKKSLPAGRQGWEKWSIKSLSLEDLKKQY